MRKPSRFMPQAAERRLGLLGYIALAAMAWALLHLLLKHPVWTLAALLALAATAAIAWKSSRARLVQLAAGRSHGGGICAFARSFDLRQVDPWVVRAVYEEIVRHFEGLGAEVEVRADDDLFKDLGIDPDDLDMGIAIDVAARTGRTFDGYRTNPHFGETNTVRGLVMFFNAQPRAA